MELDNNSDECLWQGYVRLAVVFLEILIDDDDVMINMIDISYEMSSNSLRTVNKIDCVLLPIIHIKI